MEEIRTQQVIYGILEAFAAHNILHYLRDNSDAEKRRLAIGAGMAGLGYVFGPELEDRVRNLGQMKFTDEMRQRTIYAAGGAVLGTVIGQTIGPRVYRPKIVDMERLLEETEKERVHREGWIDKITERQPSGLLTLASAAWLGYSLFLDGKTPQEQRRHLWGLGAGAVGYMWGPEALDKVQNMLVPKSKADEVFEIYTRGAAALGAAGGAILGWYKGDDMIGSLRPNRRELPGEQ